jgi:aspartyl-tRNA(Asn)/glutamyl-tRNA(Gln) amidotransferase subunit B
MFTYCTGTLDYDTKGTTGGGTKFWLEIQKSNEYLEKNFKSEIIEEHVGNQTLFKATQPTPIVLARYEWFLMDELSGTFNKESILAPFRALEKEALDLRENQVADGKKQAQAERLAGVKDDGSIGRLIEEVIAQDTKAVVEFQSGKDKALNALVGKVMGLAKKNHINTDAFSVSELLRKRLVG